MALTLANTIDAADLEIEVTGVVPAAIDIGYRFRLDDELLELRAFGRGTITILGGAATESVRNRNVWAVARGLEATTWASHTSGASVLGTLPAVAVGTTEVLPEPFAGSSSVTLPIAQSDVTGLVTALAAKAPAEVISPDPAAGILAKDGEIIRASFKVDPVGVITLATFDAVGAPVASAAISTDGSFVVERADFANGLSLAADGSVFLTSGDIEISAVGGVVTVGTSAGAKLRIAANGAITFQNSDSSGTFGIDATGTIDLSGLNVKLNLPTADPVVAGALWNDTGTVKVSAG